MNDTLPFYINQVVGLLTSPWFAVLLVLGAVIAFVLVTVPAARWFGLSILLYVTTFGVVGTPVSGSGWNQLETRALAFPLNIIRDNARTFAVLCAVMLLIPAVTTVKGRRISMFTGAFFCFLLLQMWISVRLALGGIGLARGVLDFIVAVLMLLSLTLGIGRSIHNGADARALMKSMVGFGMLFVLGNVYQCVMMPSTLHQSRLAGTTPNAQTVGQIAAICLVPALFLVQDKLVSRRWRLTSTATAGALVILLLWSGSRTGMLMAAAGVLSFFGVRIHRLVLPAIGVLVSVWIGSLLFPQAFAGVARFLDTSNDRAGAWSGMYAQFLNNPVIGLTSNGAGYRESALLATLAYYGVVGGMFLLLSILLTTGKLLMLHRRRELLGPNAGLIRAALSIFVTLAVSSVFEDSLLGLLNPATITLYLCFALLAFCRDETTLQQHWPASEPAEPYGVSYTPGQTVPDMFWY